ncbi:MAG: heavy metal translocating P-type ATPase [Oscillospiraceae bacterium]|nr:heavy metal translocating P-type ATPase [Oscillospiraceae bacterium]
MTRKQKKNGIRTLTAAVLYVVLIILSHTISMNHWLEMGLFAVPYLVVGYDIIWKAVRNLFRGNWLDENFLMAIASIGAFVLGEFTEAVAVMLLYQIGEFFESFAVGRSRNSIKALMDIRPDTANVERDGQLVAVDPETLPVGSEIVVQPGERVPIDGIVLEGSSSLNTSALTGESLPRHVEAGDDVISGCVNESGLLKVRTTKEFGESTASKILDLVENASSNKAKSENFITKFAKYYTPIVVGAAVLLAVLPPVIRQFAMGIPANWSDWIYRALTFLVISCPCAIVISVPLSFFGGIGGASKQGILIKGANYMETLAGIRRVVFDKTGTITRGNFVVTGIHHSTMEDEALLDLAAHAESGSSHPISRSIQAAYGKTIDRSRVTELNEISGKGVVARVDGLQVAVGNEKLMNYLQIPDPVPCSSIGTVVHVAIDGKYAGHMVISDEIKPHAKEAVSELYALGVKRTYMLTGDRKEVADAVAKEVGVSEVHAGLLPAEKVGIVEDILQTSGDRERVAFIGDGINDAPVLTRSDIGIAMGGLGSDAAIEAADVVLMDDDPLKISKAMRIAKKCLRIVRSNIVFALAVKLVCLVLGGLGIAGMWLAIFADVGVMILCVLNAMRCLRTKNL